MSIKYKICLWGVVCTLALLIRSGSFQHLDNVKDYRVESQSAQHFVRIYKPGVSDVQLQCNNNERKANRRRMESHGINWHYKRCGKNEGFLPCNDSSLPDDWETVPCGKSRCRVTLELGKATPEFNGLYRCSIKNKTPEPKILTIYEVEIGDAPEVDYGREMDNAPNYPSETSEPPVRISRPAGGEVELQCKSKVKPAGRRTLHSYIWHYKKCGYRYDLPSCSQFVEVTDLSDWRILAYNGKEYRDRRLDLGRPKEDDNGLYRCSIRTKDNAKIVVTYELEIVDKANMSAEILTAPQNLTVHVGQPAPFQCKVYSKVMPTILWLRQRVTERVDTKFFYYLNESYEQMKSDQINFSKGIYLSKLVLPMVSQSDAGVYACIVINNNDVNNRTAYLTVIPKYFSSNATSSEYDISSLNWLFLIPAATALIPATVWLCCLWRRRKRRGHAAATSTEASRLSRSNSYRACNTNLRKQIDSGFKYQPVSETQNKDANCGQNRDKQVG